MIRKVAFWASLFAVSGCSPICPKDPMTVDLRSVIDANIILDAIEVWNDALQYEIFEPREQNGRITIFKAEFLAMDGEELNGLAYRHWDAYREVNRCTIHLAVESVQSQTRVLAHELGHCLGLDDEEEVSQLEFINVMGHGETVLPHHIEYVHQCLEE